MRNGDAASPADLTVAAMESSTCIVRNWGVYGIYDLYLFAAAKVHFVNFLLQIYSWNNLK